MAALLVACSLPIDSISASVIGVWGVVLMSLVEMVRSTSRIPLKGLPVECDHVKGGSFA